MADQKMFTQADFFKAEKEDRIQEKVNQRLKDFEDNDYEKLIDVRFSTSDYRPHNGVNFSVMILYKTTKAPK